MYIVYFARENGRYLTTYPAKLLHKSDSVWMIPGTVGVDD